MTPVKGPFDPQTGYDPQAEKHCSNGKKTSYFPSKFIKLGKQTFQMLQVVFEIEDID